ncbi:MAG: 30S ribosomal protein S24e [Candidatus Nanoarchaeia archaeon]|nr:30S ribosomal protein S24e [Candidatus Nanoarchaeia archaeon]MDD5239472.1 30S ribosomal protein S24e [Candidatus Nanoarchaeia archaeon]
METKILEQKENKLIGRNEIKFEIVYEQKAPVRAEAVESIATAAGAQKDFLVLNRMANVFGVHKLAGMVHVYKSKEDMIRYETRNILVRNKLAEKKVKAVAAPAAKKKGGK